MTSPLFNQTSKPYLLQFGKSKLVFQGIRCKEFQILLNKEADRILSLSFFDF